MKIILFQVQIAMKKCFDHFYDTERFVFDMEIIGLNQVQKIFRSEKFFVNHFENQP